MKNAKRIISFAALGCICASTIIPLASCAASSEEKTVLRIYNSEDYICDEDSEEDGYIDLITAFEEEYGVTVEYSTYGTNENMYNELNINPGSYDLVCPSDYMIMKMKSEGMLEEFTSDFFTDDEENAYYNGVSDYIKDLFESYGWTKYAACYMWGTMGFMYDPSVVQEGTLQYWTDIANEDFAHKFTLKDSVRDTYFLAVAYVNHDELLSYAEKYSSGEMTSEEYNAAITEIMNSTDQETVSAVQSALRELKKSVYGFEVDSGKNDMVTGKICINFCWSGDAAYAIYEAAEENDMTLYYSVPLECTNVWFDGWVMPKGANVELAQKFINFISRPENAIANMNYIGYTSSIATEEVLDYVLDSYSTDEGVTYDLSYFFGEGTVFTADEDSANGMLLAQYPTAEIINRAAIMQYFDDEASARINMMWEDVKGAEVPIAAVVFIGAVAAVIAIAYVLVKYGDAFVKNKPKKGYRKVEK